MLGGEQWDGTRGWGMCGDSLMEQLLLVGRACVHDVRFEGDVCVFVVMAALCFSLTFHV